MAFGMGFSPGGSCCGYATPTTGAKAHLHFMCNAALKGPLFQGGVNSMDVFQAIGLRGHKIEQHPWQRSSLPLVPRTLAKYHTFNNIFTVVWSQNTVITVWTSPPMFSYFDSNA